MPAQNNANLTIMFTDIVGFTETTATQSRLQTEQLLKKHHNLLLPIIKNYRGRNVKTIGDALLNVFNSPTDALICAMSIQDALFEFNREQRGQAIHVRIALHVGEVRISDNDVIGDPVNVTSRIESITPPDEIYLSEAVYMTMNKAEVPTEEVGSFELRGIAAPIKIFRIPRFTSVTLVPNKSDDYVDLAKVSYPFGGAHLLETSNTETKNNSRNYLFAALASIMCIMVAIAWPKLNQSKQTTTQNMVSITPASTPPTNTSQLKEAPTPTLLPSSSPPIEVEQNHNTQLIPLRDQERSDYREQRLPPLLERRFEERLHNRQQNIKNRTPPGPFHRPMMNR
jgi:adenylate cyclase